MLIYIGIVPGHAEKRVALVIGNSAYRVMPRLINPSNDAADIGAALRGLDFETIVATHLDRAGMNDALDRFSRTVEGADIAVVYYSGQRSFPTMASAVVFRVLVAPEESESDVPSRDRCTQPFALS